jgi:hypothetical protein
MEEKKSIPPLSPNLQLGFFYKLRDFRSLYLKEALQESIKQIDLRILDLELYELVPSNSLIRLASFSLRGEVLFPVPVLLEINPRLLAYYRLLLGFSQKEFYAKGPYGRFKGMEEKGYLSSSAKDNLDILCLSLIKSAEALLHGLDSINLRQLEELQLLTVGPQFRGTKNNELGIAATQNVFEVIIDLVEPYIIERNAKELIVLNNSQRKVYIKFAADPDIAIFEEMPQSLRPLVSIEIKGGQDMSNIHNRIGEAEKSHQKAKAKKFFEFITILNVDIDYASLKHESPTTSHFYRLDKILNKDEREFEAFKELLFSMIGLSILPLNP